MPFASATDETDVFIFYGRHQVLYIFLAFPKFFQQLRKRAGVTGDKECHVEREGVVEMLVADEGGLDARSVVVAPIDLAALVQRHCVVSIHNERRY